MVEFDRAGTDVVFYQYEEFAQYWRIREGVGSYSDIADLELGVCCANLGIGYHNQHTRFCYADLEDTKKQLRRFAKFHVRNAGIKFPFVESLETVDDWWDRRDDWEWDKDLGSYVDTRPLGKYAKCLGYSDDGAWEWDNLTTPKF